MKNAMNLTCAALAALVCVWGGGVAVADEQPPITYLEPEFDEDGYLEGWSEETCSEYQLVSISGGKLSLAGPSPKSIFDDVSTWVVLTNASQKLEFSEIAILSNKVNLIVCNGVEVKTAHIDVPEDTVLKIWAQSTNVYEMGRITADNASAGNGHAGIGGADGKASGEIVINGCRVEAVGSRAAAGIGGGSHAGHTSITINGGVVAAVGGQYGAGIGDGDSRKDQVGPELPVPDSSWTDLITIAFKLIPVIKDWLYDGYITINGGTVSAVGGEKAAGIGGGHQGFRDKIEINGGTVTARGGKGGAGIGDGEREAPSAIGLLEAIEKANKEEFFTFLHDIWPELTNRVSFGMITINKGKVTAMGFGGAAGIGGGNSPDTKIAAWNRLSFGINGIITINGGDVVANGGIDSGADEGAGIGGGRHSLAFGITINGGNVDATGGVGGGAGIGGGLYGSCALVRINGKDRVRAIGGPHSAGIGGGGVGKKAFASAALGIIITNGTVEARGGGGAAGIGGGDGRHFIVDLLYKIKGLSQVVAISGGNVSAIAGDKAAGIGGGDAGSGKGILISGGRVKAAGGDYGAGIGGGDGRFVRGDSVVGEVTIVGDAFVEAQGGRYGAGIGGGNRGQALVMIEGGTVHAKAGEKGGGAGIGGGDGYGSTVSADGSGWVTIAGGTVYAYGGEKGAGIGGGYTGNGSVMITNGHVTARGGTKAAGIGGGNSGNGFIQIVDGVVNATGGYQAAGIGGGDGSYCSSTKGFGDISIYSGNVTANGGESGAGIGSGYRSTAVVKVFGGTVTATGGKNAAGIGGGNGNMSTHSTDGNATVEIYNGTVRAYGGEKGAGIGGGYTGKGKVTISGGDVTARGGSQAAGIGGGNSGNGEVDIAVATVNATGGYQAAGIGGGDGAYRADTRGFGDITIRSGNVTANGGESGAGIGSGYRSTAIIKIHDGTVTANGGMHGAGIGGGNGNGSTHSSDGSATVTINGGIVNAAGGQHGAGIGGGWTGRGTVTINGGRVDGKSPVGDSDAAGIGGGRYAGANVFINGGTVSAYSKFKIDIGGGRWRYGETTITGGSIFAGKVEDAKNKDRERDVYPVTVSSPATPPVSVDIRHGGAKYNYGDKDIYPRNGNQYCFWLPNDEYNITIGGRKMECIVAGGPTEAYEIPEPCAVTVNGIDCTEGGSAFAFDAKDGILSVNAPGTYALAGCQTNSEVCLVVNADATLVLSNVYLASYAPATSVMKIMDGCKVNVRLVGANYLLAKSDRYGELTAEKSSCGIEVAETASLVIEADPADTNASLTVMGTCLAAGIGGNCGARNGAVTVKSGRVGVLMGQEGQDVSVCGGGAGIGSGAFANNGPVTVEGGFVSVGRAGCETCLFAHSGASIGSGGVPEGLQLVSDDRAADDVVIAGGTVVAKAGNGAGIGSGAGNATVGVAVEGGSVEVSAAHGAGLGAGYLAKGAHVRISGGTVETVASPEAAGIGSGAIDATNGKVTVGVAISGGIVTARDCAETNAVSTVSIGYGSDVSADVALNAVISGGTVVADTIGRGAANGASGDGFADVRITGGSVFATLVNGDETLENAKNDADANVWPVMLDGRWNDGTAVVPEGLTAGGYGTKGIVAVEGKVCLWLPSADESHAFVTKAEPQDYAWTALVDEAPTIGLLADLTGVTVNGDDIFWKSGEGWSFTNGVLTLAGDSVYVVSDTSHNRTVASIDIRGDADVTFDGVVLGDGSATATNLVTIATNVVNLSLTNGSAFCPGGNFATFGILPGAVLNLVGEQPNTDLSIDYNGGFVVSPNPERLRFTSEEEASKVASVTYVGVPDDAVAAVISDEDYASYFTVYPKPGAQAGTWTLGYDFSEETTNLVHQAIDSDETLSSLALSLTNSAPSAVVYTLPGLYYGVVGAADVTEMDAADVPAGGWLLGDGSKKEVTGEKPESATDKAFYRLRVTARP